MGKPKILNITHHALRLSSHYIIFLSLDPLDDTQIEQLMKDATLQRAAEDILNAQATETNLLSENECKNDAWNLLNYKF